MHAPRRLQHIYIQHSLQSRHCPYHGDHTESIGRIAVATASQFINASFVLLFIVTGVTTSHCGGWELSGLQPRLGQVAVQRARDATADHHGLSGLSLHGSSQCCLVADGRLCEVQPWQPHETDAGGCRGPAVDRSHSKLVHSTAWVTQVTQSHIRRVAGLLIRVAYCRSALVTSRSCAGRSSCLTWLTTCR